jgi:hypothetical protein
MTVIFRLAERCVKAIRVVGVGIEANAACKSIPASGI